MGSIFLQNITLDGQRCDIIIGQGMIRAIRPAGEIGAKLRMPGNEALAAGLASGVEVVDCTGKVAMPGFINMHTHAGMALMRGMQEDCLLQDWIANIWRIEEKIDAEFVYWSTKVAALEMIRTGTTTFNDQYWFSPAARKAAVETGIRPVISYVILDRNDPAEAERQRNQCVRMYEKAREWDDGSIFEIAFHAVYSVSEPMILWATEFAREHNLLLHIHLSETRDEVENCRAAHGGLSPVAYLDRLGVLDERVLAAHTLWLSEDDIRILGERRVNCVHNINSNLKIASGYRFPYNELRDAGANVCLGTDGCASSNNLDMLEAMKTAALLQKAWREDPKAMPLDELIAVATRNGAKALGIPAGEIREGKLADLLIVDTDSSFFLSPGSFAANFVYSAHSDCIDSVIAGGRFVMRNRKVNGEQEILQEARKVLKTIK